MYNYAILYQEVIDQMKLKLDALGCGCWEKNGYSLPKFDIGAMRA